VPADLIEAARQVLLDGGTITAAARAAKTSRTTILNYIRSGRLPASRYRPVAPEFLSDAQLEVARNALSQGLKVAQAAAIVGCKPQRIASLIRRGLLPRLRKRLTEEDFRRAGDMLNGGATITRVARFLGVNYATIRRAIIRGRLPPAVYSGRGRRPKRVRGE
jgi:DNA invertase Pin-like site-specific DNA recombinase